MKNFPTYLTFLYTGLVLSLSILIGCTASTDHGLETTKVQGGEWSEFKGAWFTINYPPRFKPVPSLLSSTADGYDSAEFISSDGRVSFYVYAPQWGGEPVDIILDPQTEYLVEEVSELQNGRITNKVKICTKGETSCRIIHDVIDQEGSIRTTLVIKYSDDEVWRQYQQDYLKFQLSLQQFTD